MTPDTIVETLQRVAANGWVVYLDAACARELLAHLSALDTERADLVARLAVATAEIERLRGAA